MDKVKVLFVCLGNICRSPAAETIMLHTIQKMGLSDQFIIDSAGTYGGHSGSKADNRMRQAAAKRGYNITSRSRQISISDFDYFDHIIVMDDSNYINCKKLSPSIESDKKIEKIKEYFTTFNYDYVPDPYYEGSEGFELVLDMLEEATNNLLSKLSKL